MNKARRPFIHDTGDKTKKILETEIPPSGKELKPFVGELTSEFEFVLGNARELLAKAADADPAHGWIVQQLAICTYKDEEILLISRFSDALLLLEEIGLRESTVIGEKGIAPKTLPKTLASVRLKARRGGLGKQLAAGSALFFESWGLCPTTPGVFRIGIVAAFAFLVPMTQ